MNKHTKSLFAQAAGLEKVLSYTVKRSRRFYGKYWQLAASTCSVNFKSVCRLFTVIITHGRAVYAIMTLFSCFDLLFYVTVAEQFDFCDVSAVCFILVFPDVSFKIHLSVYSFRTLLVQTNATIR